MNPTILFVHTYYPEFLNDLYTHDSTLSNLEYAQQHRRIFDTYFGVGDAYSDGLRRLGCDAWEVIVNADVLQERWAEEHDLQLVENIHDRRRQIVAAQIKHYEPDVLYVFEWNPLGDGFLADVKSQVQLIAGQVASPLHQGRTYAPYDVIFSSFPPLVDYFHAQDKRGEYLKLAFDNRVLDKLSSVAQSHDVSFVGGFAPSHPDRIHWLEKILKKVDVDIFGYGAEKTEAHSLVRTYHRGPAWGLNMYEVLRRSRLSLNRHAHIDIDGKVTTNFANNMRLYEATGVETCLITELRDNLSDMFVPDDEVITYSSDEECIEKIHYYLKEDKKRLAIAAAGYRRTIKEHTYLRRMGELLDMIKRRLR